ncbi:MAG TPA: MMPL family transporter [Candidatus Bathyarchaeia archaeon]|nr:MMPL family transporter [Candidatus Bathyarchaeia archaeon]
MVILCVVVAAVAVAPSLAPRAFPMLHPLDVDTDPENMLSEDEAVRIFHDRMKRALSLNDMVVVGVVNETHPQGVFNPESLRHVYDLTQFAKALQWPSRTNSAEREGVIEVDIIAPSTVDNIEQGGPGEVKFEWLMAQPPETDADALAIRDKARRIPFLDGTLVSEDGKALALYLPLTSKDLSYRVYKSLRAEIAKIEGNDRYFITGLPVAEDTFGVEMFKQMAISAPVAMLVIFLLLLYFFRKLVLIVSPLIVALATVVLTMGLLVATGNTIHIMSSMIPIFIMPIAVLDSVHILSEFFDQYQKTRDRRKTIIAVMNMLFTPMLYTSLTTVAGFASLALTPIPPVQVFGLFIAIGVSLAWVLTVTFVPAFVMFIPDKSLKNFGLQHTAGEAHKTRVSRMLEAVGEFSYNRAKLVIALSGAAVVLALVGISMIQINDNPIKWFSKTHPIRVADRVLNEHFGGTYMAYLALRAGSELPGGQAETGQASEPVAVGEPALPEGIGLDSGAPALPEGLGGGSEPELPAGLGGAEVPAEQEAAAHVESKEELFKNPEALRYIAGLQDYLKQLDVVGKSNSLADIVKTVHRELMDGSEAQYRIPDSRGAVAETLVQYASSHRPQDLWHFATPDFRHSSIWVQLKSGDNKDMAGVIEAVEQFFSQNPPPPELAALVPEGLEHQWFGLTYINVIWQDKMVRGMLASFLGSFLVVLLMMIVLFRSGLWGFLSMMPLTITIGLIYGVIGLIGKDYDMPVAVLSSLTLGLAVDFSIHLLARSRSLYAEHGSWAAAYRHLYGEPARAVARNIVVIAVGFLPLLFAPLVPYKTVGIFLASILLVSGVTTFVVLPALVRLLEPLMFPKTRVCTVTCRCATCVVTTTTAVLLVAVNVGQFLSAGWTTLTWVSLVAIAVLAGGCGLMSRREACRQQAGQNKCESNVA